MLLSALCPATVGQDKGRGALKPRAAGIRLGLAGSMTLADDFEDDSKQGLSIVRSSLGRHRLSGVPALPGGWRLQSRLTTRRAGRKAPNPRAIVAQDRFSVTAGFLRQRETVRSDPAIARWPLPSVHR